MTTTPPPKVPKNVPFGWCITGHHFACPGTFKSTLDGRIMVCTCPHHEQIKKEMEELL